MKMNAESSPAHVFEDYLKSNGYAPRSIVTMKRTLDTFKKWLDRESMEADQVNYRDILAYMKHLQKTGVSQRTIQHYLISVRHYYNHLLAEKEATLNPLTGLKIQGVKRKVLYHIFQPHQLHAIYNSFQDETLKGRRNKVMLGLLVYQGLRTEELGRLEVNHIKLKEGKIDVPGGIRRNGRMMNLESHQIMEMYDYILQVRPEILKRSKRLTNKLFVSPEGGTIVSNFVSGLMVRIRKQNPQVKNAKQLRASVITKWLRMYNLREVQYLAGHRYISSTESYLENEMEGLQEEVNQYHPLG